jgi:dCMP deaminase
MNWDQYYLDLCNTVASNSKCLSRKIGAIVVMDKSIISTGYNGPPRGVSSCDKRWGVDEYLEVKKKENNILWGDVALNIAKCPRQILGYKSGDGLDLCIAGHAERNSLINAARHGIAVKGAIMYMNCPIPCSPCLVEIINAGISEIVCTELAYYDRMAAYLVSQSGIKVRKFD